MIEYYSSYDIELAIKFLNAKYIFNKDIIYFGYNNEKGIYEVVYER